MLFAFSLLILSSSAFAAKVTQVKNKKVLITLEGDSASVGSEFFVINASGKKVAIIKVTQVKGDKAIADISKGSAQVGYSLQARGGGSAASSGGESSDSYYDSKLNNRVHNGNSMGIVGGYLMNSMTASFLRISTPVTASMSGTGFGALGYYDYAVNPSITLRGMVGVEQYNVSGTASDNGLCSNSPTCDVKLNYLSFYGYGRWNFIQGKFKTWLGAGYGYLYAIGKESTVLKSDQISANQIFVGALGMDIRMSPKSYIPVSLEYGMFPSSDSVKANIMYLRAGYAWNL